MKLESVLSWIKKIKVDTKFVMILLLAFVTEVPRWTVTFIAIHEPLWVGISIAILISYAIATGWKAFFELPEPNWILFGINVTSLVCSVFVITPVIFAMTTMAIEDVNLSLILNPVMRMVWATVLSTLTFIPLIQVAIAEALLNRGNTGVKNNNVEIVENNTQKIIVGNNRVEDGDKKIAEKMLLEGFSVKEILGEVDLSSTTVYSIKKNLNGQINGKTIKK